MHIVFGNGSCLDAVFYPDRGLFIGEHLDAPGSGINSYNIRSGSFAYSNDVTSFPRLTQKAANHEEAVKWIRDNYPEFKF